MKIYNSRIHKIENIKDIINIEHDLPDMNGEIQKVKCAEYTVIGKNSEWRDYMYLDEFEKNKIMD